MSVKNTFIVASISVFTLFSCQKEEFTPQTTTPSEETTVVDSNPFNMGQRIPIMAVAQPRAIGKCFTVDITYMDAPATTGYRYQIREAESNAFVDEGMIYDGQSTNWVLDPCTEYKFEFWGSEYDNYSVIQTLRSDGCDGDFNG